MTAHILSSCGVGGVMVTEDLEIDEGGRSVDSDDAESMLFVVADTAGPLGMLGSSPR